MVQAFCCCLHHTLLTVHLQRQTLFLASSTPFLLDHQPQLFFGYPFTHNSLTMWSEWEGLPSMVLFHALSPWLTVNHIFSTQPMADNCKCNISLSHQNYSQKFHRDYWGENRIYFYENFLFGEVAAIFLLWQDVGLQTLGDTTQCLGIEQNIRIDTVLTEWCKTITG